MALATKTQGLQLQLGSEASPQTFTAIANVTSVSGLGGTKSDLDATNFDSLAREFLVGLEDPGSLSSNIMFSAGESTHVELWNLKRSGQRRQFRIVLNDTTDVTKTFFEFTASVQQFQINSELDSLVEGAVQFRISGDIVLVPGTNIGSNL